MNKYPNCLIVILVAVLVLSCEKTIETKPPVNSFTFVITNDRELKAAIAEYLNKNAFPTSTISEFDYEKLILLGNMTTKTGVILTPDKVDESRYLFFSINEKEITKGLIMQVEKIEGQTITAIIKSPTGKEIVEATYDSNANSLKPEKVLKSLTEEEWLCNLIYYGLGAVTGFSFGEVLKETLIHEALKDGKAVISSSKLTAIGIAASLA